MDQLSAIEKGTIMVHHSIPTDTTRTSVWKRSIGNRLGITWDHFQRYQQLTQIRTQQAKRFERMQKIQRQQQMQEQLKMEAQQQEQEQQQENGNTTPTSPTTISTPAFLSSSTSITNINSIDESEEDDNDDLLVSNSDAMKEFISNRRLIQLDVPRTFPELVEQIGRSADNFYSEITQLLEMFAVFRPSVGYVSFSLCSYLFLSIDIFLFTYRCIQLGTGNVLCSCNVSLANGFVQCFRCILQSGGESLLCFLI